MSVLTLVLLVAGAWVALSALIVIALCIVGSRRNRRDGYSEEYYPARSETQRTGAQAVTR